MKQQFKTMMLAAAFLLAGAVAFAQKEKTASPAWVSEKGYWVLESNENSPLQHTVRFYTNDNVLVYTENIGGFKLNPGKRKVKMKLKQVLETSVIAWQKSKQPEVNRDYVAAVLK
jgi:hypothetical protein